MKQLKLSIILSIIVLLSSCKKDPHLDVNFSFLTFSDNTLNKTLTITNTGGKELEWNITEDINWLGISKVNGIIEGQSEHVVNLNAIKYNAPGTYNSTFLISTNGGNKNITVEMTLDFIPKIFPGIGISEMNLGDSYNHVKQTYGEPDEIESNYIESINMYELIAIYNTPGIGFFFGNPENYINDDDNIICIGVTFPSNGVTDMNIGIDTPFSNVAYGYGEPDEIYHGNYLIHCYFSKGTDFLSYDSKVGLIWVYTPVDLNKAGNTKPFPFSRKNIFK